MFTLVRDEPDQHLYRYGSLLLNIHWDELKLAHLTSITEECERIIKQHGQMSSIVLMRGDVNIDLSTEARRAASNMVSRFDRYNTGQAVVIEEQGFRASLARSVITGINLLARSRASQRVFQSPQESLKWLCTLPTQPREIRVAADELAVPFEKILRERRRSKEHHTPVSP